MSLNPTVLTQRVRRMVGNPKASLPEELSDLSIEDELRGGLAQLDIFAPNWALYNFNTVGDGATPEYLVAPNVDRVLECYWIPNEDLGTLFGPGFEVLLYSEYPVYDLETGYYKQILAELAQRRYQAQFDWDFNPGNRMIRLIPNPTAVYPVYYLAAKPWDYDTIPAGRENILVRWTVAQCLKILGRTRAKMSGVQRAGGLIDYGAVDGLTRDGQYEEDKVRADLEAESARWLALF